MILVQMEAFEVAPWQVSSQSSHSDQGQFGPTEMGEVLVPVKPSSLLLDQEHVKEPEWRSPLHMA